MTGIDHHDAEVFERMAAELRRVAQELRQTAGIAGPGAEAPDPADRLEAYAAAIVKDLQRAFG